MVLGQGVIVAFLSLGNGAEADVRTGVGRVHFLRDLKFFGRAIEIPDAMERNAQAEVADLQARKVLLQCAELNYRLGIQVFAD